MVDLGRKPEDASFHALQGFRKDSLTVSKSAPPTGAPVKASDWWFTRLPLSGSEAGQVSAG